MIDAEEAAARTQRAAAEEQARLHEAPPVAAAPEAKREAVPAVAQVVAERPIPESSLPVYGWLERVVPTPPAAADWPRELVKARQARSEAARGA